MPQLDRLLSGNKHYAAARAQLSDAKPSLRLAIVTCMDARIDVFAALGLHLGEAHVIRNAGGRASDDAIRSLVISHKLLGTDEWFVIHHTNCGMETFTDETMRALCARSLATAQLGPDGWRDVGAGPGSNEAEFIDWLTIRDQAESVVADVRRLRFHPLVPGDVTIHGYLYDVRTGRLTEVEAAARVGRADVAEAEAAQEAAGGTAEPPQPSA